MLSFFSVAMYGAHGLDNPLLVNTFTLSNYSEIVNFDIDKYKYINEYNYE